jgi:hypothetical protein
VATPAVWSDVHTRRASALIGALAAIPLAVACSSESEPPAELAVTALYDQTSGRVVLELSRELDGERITARVRRGSFGGLDCGAAGFAPVTDTGGTSLVGPAVDEALTRPVYGPDWHEGEPTAEMLAAIAAGTDSIIDVCVHDGSRLVTSFETDLFQAWDKSRELATTGPLRKADAPNGETRIVSPQQYGVRCVGELGEIPFFTPAGDGTYSTYNCLDATPIPNAVTDGSGNVTNPDRPVQQCDKPQYQYGACEGGPRVATRVNDQGTRWTVFCRKSLGGSTSARFNDISMIGHNPFTGKTCFFQNALYSKTNGAAIPHPADTAKSTTLWDGVHGGMGTGQQCVQCHDADAFVHTPWIDAARDASGRPVVPKMGFDEDMPRGDNDAPYSLVNAAGQGWTMPKHIVSAAANACTRCHRMGDKKWLSWLTRLEGTDSTFKNFLTTPAYRTFERIHWMPPNLTGLNEANWPTSDYGRAVAFLKTCITNRANCQFADIPATRPGGGEGDELRNPVALPDSELATQAANLLGVNTPGAESRCGECHALTRGTIRSWLTATSTAVDSCLQEHAPGESRVESFPNQALPRLDFRVFGPFTVGVGGRFEARLTGGGDGDLYVKKGAAVTRTVYDCRPNLTGSSEVCGPQQFDAHGPGEFYVGVYARVASTVSLTVTYNISDGSARPPLDIVNCMRMDPTRTDSPFTPNKLGIYSALAHRPWFQHVFEAAYPPSTPGNTPNTWIQEYLRFRQRVAMPKGNHPKFTQAEADVVAEWFARGTPLMETVIPDDPAPPLCTPSIGQELIDHANAMQTQGWGAINRERGLQMYGCQGTSDPQQCLSTLPTAGSRPYGVGWASFPGAQLRVLSELSYRTSYWMRSSADGRFSANGATSGLGGMIDDHQRDREVGADAAYDPGFFPDNSGFVFQGTPVGTGFCNQSLLVTNPASVSFREAQCTGGVQIGLYQHLGAGINGGDYFTVAGQFTSDNGGHSPTLRDPVADFSPSTQVTLTPMYHDGTRFRSRPVARVSTPREGDSILSPSTRLMISRLAGPESRQIAFVVRKVTATRNGDTTTITAPEVGRFCFLGGKPAVSFDERYLTYHHYIGDSDAVDLGFTGPNDPAFQPYRQRGAANIYVADMVTGVTRRVTMLNPGQYALFPHFRSDGWIYFLVRDSNTGREYEIASDAKLVID